jgi:hypothetical protein
MDADHLLGGERFPGAMKDWMIAGTDGIDSSATLACSRRANIASVRLRNAAAVSR